MTEPKNYITEDTTIRGDLTTGSSVTVAGVLEGTLTAGGEVQVLPDAVVKGDISGSDVLVGGRVEGSVPAPGGTSSNLSTEFPAIPPITSVGVPNGGGVSGFYAEIPTAPAYTPLVLPVYNQFSGIRALEFD